MLLEIFVSDFFLFKGILHRGFTGLYCSWSAIEERLWNGVWLVSATDFYLLLKKLFVIEVSKWIWYAKSNQIHCIPYWFFSSSTAYLQVVAGCNYVWNAYGLPAILFWRPFDHLQEGNIIDIQIWLRLPTSSFQKQFFNTWFTKWLMSLFDAIKEVSVILLSNHHILINLNITGGYLDLRYILSLYLYIYIYIYCCSVSIFLPCLMAAGNARH